MPRPRRARSRAQPSSLPIHHTQSLTLLAQILLFKVASVKRGRRRRSPAHHRQLRWAGVGDIAARVVAADAHLQDNDSDGRAASWPNAGPLAGWRRRNRRSRAGRSAIRRRSPSMRNLRAGAAAGPKPRARHGKLTQRLARPGQRRRLGQQTVSCSRLSGCARDETHRRAAAAHECRARGGKSGVAQGRFSPPGAGRATQAGRLGRQIRARLGNRTRAPAHR